MATSYSAEWTTDNLNKLLERMELNLTNRERGTTWSAALKNFDWSGVAFRPFTASECCSKWTEMMQKLRKIKTLSELISDARFAVDSNCVQMCSNSQQMKFPKKPASGNALYFGDNKDRFRLQNPGMSSRELMKFANDEYKKLPVKEKEEYVTRAEIIKKQYQIDKEKMRCEQAIQKEKTKVADKTIKKEGKFPKNLNGYNLFCREQKSCVTGLRKTEVLNLWSKKWKQLSKEEKNEYSRRCHELKMSQKKPNKRRYPGEPVMPSSSISVLHCKKKLKELNGKCANYRELFGHFNSQIKSLTEDEREQYEAERLRNMEIYKEKLQNWFKKLPPSKQTEYCKNKPSKMRYLQKLLLIGSFHRTSDSEDEDFDDASESFDQVNSIVIDSDAEEKPEVMFDIF